MAPRPLQEEDGDAAASSRRGRIIRGWIGSGRRARPHTQSPCCPVASSFHSRIAVARFLSFSQLTDDSPLVRTNPLVYAPSCRRNRAASVVKKWGVRTRPKQSTPSPTTTLPSFHSYLWRWRCRRVRREPGWGRGPPWAPCRLTRRTALIVGSRSTCLWVFNRTQWKETPRARPSPAVVCPLRTAMTVTPARRGQASPGIVWIPVVLPPPRSRSRILRF